MLDGLWRSQVSSFSAQIAAETGYPPQAAASGGHPTGGWRQRYDAIQAELDWRAQSGDRLRASYTAHAADRAKRNILLCDPAPAGGRGKRPRQSETKAPQTSRERLAARLGMSSRAAASTQPRKLVQHVAPGKIQASSPGLLLEFEVKYELEFEISGQLSLALLRLMLNS